MSIYAKRKCSLRYNENENWKSRKELELSRLLDSRINIQPFKEFEAFVNGFEEVLI